MIDAGIKKTKDNVKGTIKSLNFALHQQVVLGYPAHGTPRRGDPINNATIAKINNEGFKGVIGGQHYNVPARPFMTEGFNDFVPKMKTHLLVSMKAAMRGDIALCKKSFERCALDGKSTVQMKLKNGSWKPLAPMTIAMRKLKRKSGIAGTKPLYDTGQLVKAFQGIVRTTYKAIGGFIGGF